MADSVMTISGGEAGPGGSIGFLVDGADDGCGNCSDGGCGNCSDGNVPLGESRGIV